MCIVKIHKDDRSIDPLARRETDVKAHSNIEDGPAQSLYTVPQDYIADRSRILAITRFVAYREQTRRRIERRRAKYFPITSSINDPAACTRGPSARVDRRILHAVENSPDVVYTLLINLDRNVSARAIVISPPRTRQQYCMACKKLKKKTLRMRDNEAS